MMTVTISNGLVILLLFLQNIYAQQGVNNNVVNNAGMSQPKATCNSAAVNMNSLQPAQLINWQQPSNMQQAPVSQQSPNFQQLGVNLQQNQNPLSDIFSALHNLRFSMKPQGANPLSTVPGGYKQNFEQAIVQPSNQQSPNNQQYPEKPTFTFQFVPATHQSKPSENQQVMQTALPIQYLTSSQNQQGPSYYVQNQPTNGIVNQPTANTGQPIVFTVNPQQPTSGQSQPIVFALQPSSCNNQQKTPQTAQGPSTSSNPMALLMSQLQSPTANPDISSIIPMLMNSKQEKSGGMKALLPLILSLLNDKGCGCPHCGCSCNNGEPTINGGYSNQINYSERGSTANIPEPTRNKSVANSVGESDEVDVPKTSKKYKTNVINDVSDEASDEDDEYEDYDD